MVAVLKIIFDRSKTFKPWGILLGDENLIKNPIRFPKLRIKNKKIEQELTIKSDSTE
jgi:hypothetical protein